MSLYVLWERKSKRTVYHSFWVSSFWTGWLRTSILAIIERSFVEQASGKVANKSMEKTICGYCVICAIISEPISFRKQACEYFKFYMNIFIINLNCLICFGNAEILYPSARSILRPRHHKGRKCGVEYGKYSGRLQELFLELHMVINCKGLNEMKCFVVSKCSG